MQDLDPEVRGQLEEIRARGLQAQQEEGLFESLLDGLEASAVANLREIVQDPTQAHLWACRLWALHQLRKQLRRVVQGGVEATTILSEERAEPEEEGVAETREDYMRRAREARERAAERRRQAGGSH